MLAVVAFLGGSFSFLIWNAYRTARLRAVGEAPGAGAPSGAARSVEMLGEAREGRPGV